MRSRPRNSLKPNYRPRLHRMDITLNLRWRSTGVGQDEFATPDDRRPADHPWPDDDGSRCDPGMMGAPAEKPRAVPHARCMRLWPICDRSGRDWSLVLIFAITSTLFAIVSPRILGNVTNKIVNGYTQERAYDQVNANLPPGIEIPSGTTGAELLAQLPPEVSSKHSRVATLRYREDGPLPPTGDRLRWHPTVGRTAGRPLSDQRHLRLHPGLDDGGRFRSR